MCNLYHSLVIFIDLPFFPSFFSVCRAFTVTAVAQMCILGLMWVSGVFLFQEDPPVAVSYIFTIFNSLQGALVFIMHCLLSKQVRTQYICVKLHVDMMLRPKLKQHENVYLNKISEKGKSSDKHARLCQYARWQHRFVS